MAKAGFVAIVGRPNVGKSTLLNALVGEKVAITSPRVQTTRHKIRGVLTVNGKGQIVFLDTPGFSKPLDRMGESLNAAADHALDEADMVMLVVDGSLEPGKGDVWLADRLLAAKKPGLLVINKIDSLTTAPARQVRRDAYKALITAAEAPWDAISVSAKTGKSLGDVPSLLFRRLPNGAPIYDADELTDQTIRNIAQEIIREKAMRFTAEELPHSIAVFIDHFDESDPACVRISATVFVDRKSQKGMVIGKSGQCIKQIGQTARQEIEPLVDTQVFLDLQVKVKENWRKDAQFLKLLGMES